MSIRGLDERCALALYIVTAPIAPLDDLEEMLVQVERSAFERGIADFDAGLCEMPFMFAEEPILCREWISGYKQAQMLDEMCNCSGCRPAVPTHDWDGLCAIHDR